MTAFAVADLLPPGVRAAGGRITLDGVDLADLPAQRRRHLAGGSIGFVFQDPLSSFNPVRTIGSLMVESIRRHRGGTVRAAREQSAAALARVELPQPLQLLDRFPHELSGGQRQRAMIALATVNDPALLIADEPTTALDATVQKRVLALLAREASGRGLILITHDIAVAASMCQRLLVMRGGRVVETGRVADVLERPRHPYTAALVAAARIAGRRAAPQLAADLARTPLLEVRNLTVTFHGRGRPVRALDSCALAVERGQIVAIVGESGSGKSTLARAIAGVLPPPPGTVRLDGRDVTAPGGRAEAAERRRIQMVFQDPDASLNPLHRVATIMAEPLRVIGGRGPAAIRARVAELLALVQLDQGLLGRRPRELSGGQKQRVAIARALAIEPDVLVADEVLSSLDVTTQAQIAALLRELVSRLGIGMLFISHDLGMVERIADRVAVLRSGIRVDYGPVEDVFGGRVPYARELLDARLALPVAVAGTGT
jgi:peptide/nickel transport system ATP-binding protein